MARLNWRAAASSNSTSSTLKKCGVTPKRISNPKCSWSIRIVMLTRVDVLLLPVVFVYGLATAPQFSLMLAFIGSRIPLSGKMTSRIVGSAGLSSTVMPWFVGQLLERVSLWTYPVALICCSATVLVMAQIIEAKLPRQLNASV